MSVSDESAGRTLGVSPCSIGNNIFYTCVWLLLAIRTSEHSNFWPSVLLVFCLDIWQSGHLDFWPSFPMPKKCPDWDILDLPCGYTNLKFLTFSLESETTNMLLPTFHAQFSRETTKPKTQPGRLAASWHIWYSFLSSRLQKDCVFSLSFIFFHCILVYLERMGQFFKCLITLWWYSLVWK